MELSGQVDQLEAPNFLNILDTEEHCRMWQIRWDLNIFGKNTRKISRFSTHHVFVMYSVGKVS